MKHTNPKQLEYTKSIKKKERTQHRYKCNEHLEILISLFGIWLI